MRNAIDVARHTRVAPPHAARPLIALVFEGLSEEQKQLPSMLAFDPVGSQLFERVCEQPEYFLARAEATLLRRHAAEIGAVVGPQAAIVEYGAGAGRLGALLLDAMTSAHSYVPIDVDATQLARCREAIRASGRALRIHPLHQDFRQFVALPTTLGGARRRVAYFPGSSVASFPQLETVALLNSMRETMGPGGGLLVGVDLLKERQVHLRSWLDAAGTVAAFNRNVLLRLNREIDATFDPDGFEHRVTWNESEQRLEMGLLSLRAQAPTIAGIGVAIAAGEEIRTSVAHKYTLEEFASLARIAGWMPRSTWVDPEHDYALQYLEAGD
jgi:L-histidine N-alpha-methyltransferase